MFLTILRNSVGKVCRGIAFVAMWAIFGITLVLVVDIVLRNTTENMAVLGTYELTEVVMVIIIFLGLAVTQFEKDNIQIKMLIEKFPWRVRTYINAVISALTTLLCIIVFNAGLLQVKTTITTKVTTAVLYLPFTPFVVVMTIGLMALAIVLALDTIEYFVKAIKNLNPDRIGKDAKEENAG